MIYYLRWVIIFVDYIEHINSLTCIGHNVIFTILLKLIIYVWFLLRMGKDAWFSKCEIYYCC